MIIVEYNLSDFNFGEMLNYEARSEQLKRLSMQVVNEKL